MKTQNIELTVVARIHTGFPAKFGIPRQSGLVDTEGVIIFEPPFRNQDMLRGIEEYSHLWIVWGFSESMGKEWHPTVRPPRLGGNQRMGVFATRSPFRPNPIGISCVKLEKADTENSEGPVLWVTGVDMMDGTPIYDIKPYLSYVDSIPEASGGFSDRVKGYALEVDCPKRWMKMVPEAERERLLQILSQDPRPSYQNDPGRVYGMEYAGMEVRFRVESGRLIVCEVTCINNGTGGKLYGI